MNGCTGRTGLLWTLFALALLPLAAGGAEAREVRVGIPLGGRIEADQGFRWRDAGGRSGRGAELDLQSLRPPVQLRGSGAARSGSHSFPLPVEVVSYQGSLYAVVPLELERYLAGVLPVEMHPQWPSEALKAQGVVARTFALQRLARGGRGDLDLIAGTVDQAFRWDPEPPRSVVTALRATRGRVLTTPEGALAEVSYHSCCGGHTAEASEVWQTPVPGIATVDDPHCTVCPNYFWSVRFDPTDLGGRLGRGPIHEIRVLSRGPSGRIARVALFDDAGALELTGMALRSRLGATELPSTLAQVRAAETEAGAVWLFQGSGSGHGAGLCQWGARVQAEQGRNWGEILQFYFPRLDVGRAP